MLLLSLFIIQSSDIVVDAMNDASGGSRLPPASGIAIYYVDSILGSDKNDGLSQSTPWRSLSKVDSSRSMFLPGDEVLLKRGSTWKERLYVRFSGSSGSPIILGAYGTGEKPTIDVQGLSSVSGIEVQASNITIRDIQVLNSTSQGVRIADSSKGAYDITLVNLEVYHSAQNGIVHSLGGGRLIILNATIDDAGNCGIALLGSPSRHLSHVLVEDCRVSNVTTNDGITVHLGDSTVTTPAGSNFTLRDNHVETCYEQGFDITTGNDILLINNTSTRNRAGGIVVGHTASNVTISGHHSWDEQTAANTGSSLLVHSGPLTVMNSIFEGGNYHVITIKQGPISGPIDLEMYNNLFIYGGNGNLFSLYNPRTFRAYNNIFMTNGLNFGTFRFLDRQHPPDKQGFDLDGNIYYAPNGVSGNAFYSAAGGYFNFSQLRSVYGHEKNGSDVDPMIANFSSGDFRLSNSSCAIDAGRSIPDLEGASSFKIIDFLGNRIYGRRDIGPVEYQPVHSVLNDTFPLNRMVNVYADGRFHYKERGLGFVSTTLRVSWKPINNSYNSSNIEKVFDIEVDDWDGEDGDLIRWTESNNSYLINISYSVGGLLPGKRYSVLMNGSEKSSGYANILGDITFLVNSTLHNKKFEVRLVPQKENLSIVNNTPSTCSTGGRLNFDLRVVSCSAVTGVNVSYYYGSSPEESKDLTLNMSEGTCLNGTWKGQVMVTRCSVEPLFYRFRIWRSNESLTCTPISRVDIEDGEPPEIKDRSLAVSHPGDQYDFIADVSDNLMVGFVRLVYRVGNGVTIEVNMTRGMNYTHTIYIPNDFAGFLYYHINASDLSGNWKRTSEACVEVIDVEVPIVVYDKTACVATTGGQLCFVVWIDDDIGVDKVTVEYWFKRSDHVNATMVGKEHYYLDIDIPSNITSSLYYVYHYCDLSGNWGSSAEVSVKISDNDPPVIRNNKGKKTKETRDMITLEFDAEISDNIGVESACVEHWIEGGGSKITFLEHTDPFYRCSIELQADEVKKLFFRFKAIDLSGNTAFSSEQFVTLRENETLSNPYPEAFPREVGNDTQSGPEYLRITSEYSVSIVPDVDSVLITDHIDLDIVVLDAFGKALEVENIIWWTVGKAGTIDENGVFLPTMPGEVAVWAEVRAGGLTIRTNLNISVLIGPEVEGAADGSDPAADQGLVLPLTILSLCILVGMGAAFVMNFVKRKHQGHDLK